MTTRTTKTKYVADTFRREVRNHGMALLNLGIHHLYLGPGLQLTRKRH